MDETSGWALVWQDEFDGEAGAPPDPAHWTCEVGGSGWGNEEWQYYRPENAALDGSSHLVITARQENPANVTCWYGPCRYTSARLVTRDKFEPTFGKVEARLKLPSGQGIWPAFWMLGADVSTVGWPQCGEIDIMEFIGREPTHVYGTVHGPGYSGANGIGNRIQVQNLAEDYHVFGVTWAPASIRWYVDGQQYHQVTPGSLQGQRWVFDRPFFILLNLAVGGRWPGYPDETSVFPQMLCVDWVRVYHSL